LLFGLSNPLRAQGVAATGLTRRVGRGRVLTRRNYGEAEFIIDGIHLPVNLCTRLQREPGQASVNLAAGAIGTGWCGAPLRRVVRGFAVTGFGGSDK
jgi:hypothetical protein